MAKGITIYLPLEVKADLENLSNKIGVSQTTLVALCTISLVENYRDKGGFIFADLFAQRQSETDGTTKNLIISLPEEIKKDLEHMSKETKISQTQLMVMATRTTLRNYQKCGLQIFVGLISPKEE